MDFDLFIVGAGPAGLTAAVYAARAGVHVGVCERETIGGKITSSPKVCNIPGFVEISGSDFGYQLYEQATTCGAELILAEVVKIDPTADGFEIHTDDRKIYTASSIILATGTVNRTLDVYGEKNLIGSKIHFCVTCDGEFYRDQDVLVIGGGNSAITEALELANIASSVTIMQDLPKLTAEQALLTQLNEYNNINILYNRKIVSYERKGDKVLVTIHDTSSGSIEEITTDGIFLAIGMIPQNDRFENIVDLNNQGYINTSAEANNETGVYVAGDCSDGAIKQVTTACAEGAKAALDAIRYLKLIAKL